VWPVEFESIGLSRRALYRFQLGGSCGHTKNRLDFIRKWIFPKPLSDHQLLKKMSDSRSYIILRTCVSVYFHNIIKIIQTNNYAKV
jgi:hypothetical protein